jgi:hypothetical protein
MATIYLDEDSGFLCYDKDGTKTPVVTNVSFYPDSIRLIDNYIEICDLNG